MLKGGNNYTRHMTMARASSWPKYMQLLDKVRELGGATRRELVYAVWKKELATSKDNLDGDVCYNWQNGPFTLLRNKGYIEFNRTKKGVFWHITQKGCDFLEKNALVRLGIDVEGPEYCGAPYPAFNKKAINESRFDDGLRGKRWNCEIRAGGGYVDWLSQEDEDPTESWETEIKRAFKANGLKKGSKIHVRFGSRDTSYIHEYDLEIQ